jgi:hypothetical protein
VAASTRAHTPSHTHCFDGDSVFVLPAAAPAESRLSWPIDLPLSSLPSHLAPALVAGLLALEGRLPASRGVRGELRGFGSLVVCVLLPVLSYIYIQSTVEVLEGPTSSVNHPSSFLLAS